MRWDQDSVLTQKVQAGPQRHRLSLLFEAWGGGGGGGGGRDCSCLKLLFRPLQSTLKPLQPVPGRAVLWSSPIPTARASSSSSVDPYSSPRQQPGGWGWGGGEVHAPQHLQWEDRPVKPEVASSHLHSGAEFFTTRPANSV